MSGSYMKLEDLAESVYWESYGVGRGCTHSAKLAINSWLVTMCDYLYTFLLPRNSYASTVRVARMSVECTNGVWEMSPKAAAERIVADTRKSLYTFTELAALDFRNIARRVFDNPKKLDSLVMELTITYAIKVIDLPRPEWKLPPRRKRSRDAWGSPRMQRRAGQRSQNTRAGVKRYMDASTAAFYDRMNSEPYVIIRN